MRMPSVRLHVPLVVTSVTIASLTLSGCGTYKKSADYHYGLHGAPTTAQQAAALSATRAYRSLIVQASQSFAAAAGKLRDAATAGNLNEAKRQWAIAQSSYDVVRGEIAAHSTTDLMIGGRLADQPFFIGRTGLHAVEQDLFSPDHSRLVTDAQSLAGKGMLLQIGLMRTIRTPERIMNTAAQNLSWAINNVIAHPQELYAQCDLLDITSTINAVAVMMDAVTPLAANVAPRDLAVAQARLATLIATLRSVSSTRGISPDCTANRLVTPAQWRQLSAQMTALLAPITTLGGDMDGFGSGRTYA